MSGRVWVFSEDMIGPALDRWAAEHGSLLPREEVDAMGAGVRAFLFSDAAAKLRVRELEPPPTPAADSTTVLGLGPQKALL